MYVCTSSRRWLHSCHMHRPSRNDCIRDRRGDPQRQCHLADLIPHVSSQSLMITAGICTSNVAKRAKLCMAHSGSITGIKIDRNVSVSSMHLSPRRSELLWQQPCSPPTPAKVSLGLLTNKTAAVISTATLSHSSLRIGLITPLKWPMLKPFAIVIAISVETSCHVIVGSVPACLLPAFLLQTCLLSAIVAASVDFSAPRCRQPSTLSRPNFLMRSARGPLPRRDHSGATLSAFGRRAHSNPSHGATAPATPRSAHGTPAWS